MPDSSFLPDNIPEVLKALCQWVVWRREQRDGEWTKVPYCAEGGGAAKSTDPGTWRPFLKAVRMFERMDGYYQGVGFVFSPDDPYCGIDFDKCINPETGELDLWVSDWLDRLNSYAEVSPSGTGIKVWVIGRLPRNAEGKCRHKKKSVGTRGTVVVELYDDVRFFTATGRVFGAPRAIEDAQEVLKALYAELFPPRAATSRSEGSASGSPSAVPDDQLIDAGRRHCKNFSALYDQGDTSSYGDDDSSADQALCNHLAWLTGSDKSRMERLFGLSALGRRDKWKDRDDYRERTIEKAVEGTNGAYTPGWKAGGTKIKARGAAQASNAPEPPQEEEPPEDREALLKSAVEATGADREKALDRLAVSVAAAGNALTDETWANRIRDAKIGTKGAFLGRVRELRKRGKRMFSRSPPPQLPPNLPPASEDDSADEEGLDAAGEAGPGLPQVNVGGGELKGIARLVWDAVGRMNSPPSIFRSGGVGVRIERDDHDRPITKILTEHSWRYELDRMASWGRYVQREEEWVWEPCFPPMDVIRDVIATRDMPLPVILRVVGAPVFGPNGELETEPGYHPGSKTFYAPPNGVVIPPVPEKPTAEEIARARDLLLVELVGEFPHVGDPDRAHTLAATILPFARSFIDGPTPLHLIEKPCPGTGATLMANLMAIPSTGAVASTMAEGKDEEEYRKKITAALLGSPNVILIDNIKRRMDSGHLANALTSTVWSDRPPTYPGMVHLPVLCVWLATANNPTVSTEMARRILRIRLDAKEDQPWLRTNFRHRNVRAWAMEHRGELVWAALVLVKAWLAAGMPEHDGVMLGMYEEYSRVLGGILQVAGVPGFLKNLRDFYDAADSEGAADRALIAAWWDKCEESEVTSADLLPLTTELDPPMELGEGEGRRVRFGRKLGVLRDRQFQIEQSDGEVVRVRVEKRGKFHQAQQWRLARLNHEGGDASPDGRMGGWGGLGGGLFGRTKEENEGITPDDITPDDISSVSDAHGGMSGPSQPPDPPQPPRDADTFDAEPEPAAPSEPADPNRNALRAWLTSHGWPRLQPKGGLGVGPGEVAWEKWLAVASPGLCRTYLAAAGAK